MGEFVLPKVDGARISITPDPWMPEIRIRAYGSTPEEAREAFEKAKAAIVEALSS